jgi:hypothetical protein
VDWSNERYVRVYTRDTDDWLCLSWEARALLGFLFRKVDRAGVLETKRGARGVAAIVMMPPAIVATALPELLADGCVVEHELGYCIPNFIEAQEAAQSDKQRAKESRERRRLRGRTSQPVTDRHVTSQNVTFESRSERPRDDSSHGVTARHSASLQPSQTDLDKDLERAAFQESSLDQALPFPEPDRRSIVRAERVVPVGAPPPGTALPMPPNWEPEHEPDLEEDARSLGVDLAGELVKLRGRGEEHADWQARWREWLGYAIAFARKNTRKPPQTSAQAAAASAAIAARARAEEARERDQRAENARKAAADLAEVQRAARQALETLSPRPKAAGT